MVTHKQWIAGLGLTLGVAGAAAAQGRDVQPVPVFVNGGRLERRALLLEPLGRTVLPMRTLFESLGAQVEWDSEQRAVYAWKPTGEGVRLGLGERDAQTLRMSAHPGPGNWGHVLGTHHLDAPAMMVDQRIFVPLRFASEALNADVRYVAAEPAVYIRTESVAGYRNDEPVIDERQVREERILEERRAEERRVQEEARAAEARAAEARRLRLEERRARLNERMEAVEVSLVMEDTAFDRDEPDTLIELHVANRGNELLELPFRSGRHFDVQVLQDGEVVWSWARNHAFTQALDTLTLRPGEEKVYRVRWNLRASGGGRLASGRYLVRGIVRPAAPLPALRAEQTITIHD
jgi:hypothetical protein